MFAHPFGPGGSTQADKRDVLPRRILHPFEDYPELEVTLVDDDKVSVWNLAPGKRLRRCDLNGR
jgi:hypothetical protein